MTDYSPIYDALEESGNPVTTSDMMDAGYTGFTMGEYPTAVHIVFALNALDGQTFDDPSKWAAVNHLVAALKEQEEQYDFSVEISVNGDGSFVVNFKDR